MTNLRKLWLHLRLLWAGYCPKHAKPLDWGLSCAKCLEQRDYREKIKTSLALAELHGMNGGHRG